MHWSKSRHTKYENCARRFFYEDIAAPQNEKIAGLQRGSGPPLVRHEAMRHGATRIARERSNDRDFLATVYDECRTILNASIANPADATGEFSILEVCLNAFVAETLPALQSDELAYVNDGNPVEFVYDGLTIMAVPEVAIRRTDRLDIYQMRTGKPGFRAEAELRLTAGGLTCWARRCLGEVTRPIYVHEVLLRAQPAKTHSVLLTDAEVREFVVAAKSRVQQFVGSARIADFPAQPTMFKCKFCDYTSICPEYGAFSETGYDLETLAAAVLDRKVEQHSALLGTGGEIKKVFLCHASPDKEVYVRPIARRLEAKGISYWLDEAQIGWGESLMKSVNRGLATSDYLIAFMSPHFMDRGWPQAEMAAAFVAKMRSGDDRLLPIAIEKFDKIATQYPLLADTKCPSWEDGVENIVSLLEQKIAKDRSAG